MATHRLACWFLAAGVTLGLGCSSGSPADGRTTDTGNETAATDAAPIDAALDVLIDVSSPDAGTGCTPSQLLCGPVCVSPRNDPFNCGTCGHLCPDAPNAGPACTSGACGITCSHGWGDCDHNPANGCEADLTTRANCGACGNTCAASMACSAGTCATGCPAGSSLCASGACAVLTTDANNCGTCGHSCIVPNATVACTAGTCSITNCALGYDDCNHIASDGCETTIVDDPRNCGACGNVCPTTTNGTASCVSGTCGLSCSTGYHMCGTACVSDTSPAGCGGSCSPCPTPPNAAASCTSMTCGFTCNAGFADCDGNPTNGCEVSLASTSNCGHCGTVCSGGTPMCTASGSGNVCSDGCVPSTLSVCSGSCVNLQSSVTDCGACGHTCAFPNAGASCSSGACQLGACSPGWANCDGNPSNGCETQLGTSSNCGTCGHACPATATCSGSTCVCSGGLELCGTVCVDTTTNRLDCGACGRVCAGTTICCSGICEIPRICLL